MDKYTDQLANCTGLVTPNKNLQEKSQNTVYLGLADQDYFQNRQVFSFLLMPIIVDLFREDTRPVTRAKFQNVQFASCYLVIWESDKLIADV